VAEQTVRVQWAVANEGTGTANPSWWDRVYFSTNELWDSSDRILSDVYMNSALAVGTSYTNARTITLPSVAAGRYYLILRADAAGQLWESSETNNSLVIPLDVVTADLAVSEFRITGGSIASNKVQFTWTVSNQGSGTANPSWWDRVYLSTNETWESTDHILSDVYVSQTLAIGASYANTRTVNLPSLPAGQCYLILRTDAAGQLYEAAETNNLLVIPLAEPGESPRLTISLITNLAVISWPASAVGFNLEEIPTLSTNTSWQAVTNPAVTVGDQRQVSVDPLEPSRFYRLRKP
jgi:hypothetical protein